MQTLTIEKRDTVGKKVRLLRTTGKIPGVLYGKKEVATSIVVSERDFLKVWQEAGESSVVRLTGLGVDKEALIHEVDLDPVKDMPRHVDFYVIEKGQKVEVAIPLEFIGNSPAVKEKGGVLVKVLHELHVEADPSKLPHVIEIDISSLVDFESQILVQDVAMPPGVVATADPEEVIALVQEGVEETEDAAPAPVDFSQVEVEQKGKKDGEEEAGE